MLKVKWHYQIILHTCRFIQRVWRGFRGRKQYFKKKALNSINMQFKFFNEAARIIQKYYRGFWSRKYEHDFFARKQYLNHVEEKNEVKRQELLEHQRNQMLEEQKRQEQTARVEFAELTSNLHHLSSTRAIPGVYNPPYANNKPQAFNVDIETHLKNTFKSNYTWKPPSAENINFFRTITEEQRRKTLADKRIGK